MLTFFITGAVLTYLGFLVLLHVAYKSEGGFIRSFRKTHPEEKDLSDAWILGGLNTILLIVCFAGWPLLWLAVLFKVVEKTVKAKS